MPVSVPKLWLPAPKHLLWPTRSATYNLGPCECCGDGDCASGATIQATPSGTEGCRTWDFEIQNVPDGCSCDVTWDYGDGTTPEEGGTTASHEYECGDGENFTITATLTCSDGSTKEVTVEIDICEDCYASCALCAADVVGIAVQVSGYSNCTVGNFNYKYANFNSAYNITTAAGAGAFTLSVGTNGTCASGIWEYHQETAGIYKMIDKYLYEINAAFGCSGDYMTVNISSNAHSYYTTYADVPCNALGVSGGGLNTGGTKGATSPDLWLWADACKGIPFIFSTTEGNCSSTINWQISLIF